MRPEAGKKVWLQSPENIETAAIFTIPLNFDSSHCFVSKITFFIHFKGFCY